MTRIRLATNIRLALPEARRFGRVLMREWWKVLLGVTIFVAFFFVFDAAVRFGSGSPVLTLSTGHLTEVYVLWIVAAGGLVGAAIEVEQDLQTGVMERLSIAGVSLGAIVFWRALLGLLPTLASIAIIYTLLGALYGEAPKWRHDLTIAMTAAVATSVGLAFVGASVAFLLRPASLLLLPSQIFLLGCMAAAAIPNSTTACWTMVVPLAPSISNLVQPNSFGIIAILANAVFYCVVGWTTFKYAERRARTKGTLSRP